MTDSIQQPEDLKRFIREIPDFPKKGILFYDITTLLKKSDALQFTLEALAKHYRNKKIDCVVGIEARGFIFAVTVAYLLNVGFVPIRKPKKLPAKTLSANYDLEYGQDSLEVHIDAIGAGHNVLIIDDLLATGGTAAAVAAMIESLGGKVAGLGFVMELLSLKGRDKLTGYEAYSLLKY
jgi:adenine phosphoribosyltransferase